MHDGVVMVSHHLAHLAPRFLPGQRCPWHVVEIVPEPVRPQLAQRCVWERHRLFRGRGPHGELEVTAQSLGAGGQSLTVEVDVEPI